MKQKIMHLLLCIFILSTENICASFDAGAANELTPADVNQQFTPRQFTSLVAIGGALIDVVIKCSTDELVKYGGAVGCNKFLTPEEYDSIKEILPNPIYLPGGSVANATSVYAGLGGKAVFIAAAGRDKEANLFKESLAKFEVDVRFHETDGCTGACLVFVHPDGQRSMRSIQGTEAIPDSHINSSTFGPAIVAFLEGYGIQTEVRSKSYVRAAELAKQAGSYVVITTSDLSCVRAKREVFLSLLRGPADLILMNEEEAKELAQGTLQDAINLLRECNKIGIVTLGVKGAIAIYGNEIWLCASHKVNVVDTTGAGDGFAGGFLYGFTSGWSISQCLQLANFVAGEVVAHLGPRLDRDLSDIIEQGNYKQLGIKTYEPKAVRAA